MTRITAFLGIATILAGTMLQGQDRIADESQTPSKMSEKDRAADDDRTAGHRRTMSKLVRLVPSSTVAWRSRALGHKVQAEGVAFRGHVFMDSCNIKVEGGKLDLAGDIYNGRLVRVTGILRFKDAQTNNFNKIYKPAYFFIDPESCEVVDRVGWPSLTASDKIGIPAISLSKRSSPQEIP